ncbi:MAG: efflux RND transporter periplasmic adaptor subunit [Anaerolineae bacterium]|jgi:HlyD family secretion protein|nr:efflux RND transporter periplasmic adaptor subunit [Anaerolineae bacterium]
MTNKKETQRKRRRWPWVAGALVLAAIAAPLALGAVARAGGQASVQSGEIVTVTVGDLSARATASGNVEARRDARLSLEVAGTVADVPVSVGDAVKAGDPLVLLDTAALERAVANAKLALEIQEANLSDLVDGATAAELASAQAAVDSARAHLADVQDGANPNDIASARANLASAQAAYQDLLDGPDGESVRQAEASLRNAEAALQQAQAAYDRVAGSPDIAMRREALELQQATNNLESAQAAYELATRGATDEQRKQAQASVEQARSTLQKLLDSPTAAELASAQSQLSQAEANLDTVTRGAGDAKAQVAQAQVEQAKLNLAEAEDSLAKATLRAPYDGVITAVHVQAGERASGLAVEMADTTALELVLGVDEVDIGGLAVGQPAVVTFETWPGVEVSGEIASIAPKATESNSAVVSYEVRVRLGATELPVRLGMTADADLITDAKTGVLVVPSQAITADREAGTYSVNLAGVDAEGKPTFTKTAVTIGLKDGDNTEITSGLKEGDRVLIGAITVAEPERGGFMMPPAPGSFRSGGQ